MPGATQIVFAAQFLSSDSVRGKRVLDVGSRNYNGSIKPLVMHYNPQEYIGIDVTPGRGVDLTLSATQITEHFGERSFDIIICLEMLEHTADWRTAVLSMKKALRPGGRLILTTRSVGYPCHHFPHDYWRFSVDDLEAIFSEFNELLTQRDPHLPGAFVTGRCPEIVLSPPQRAVHCFLTDSRELTLPTTLHRKRRFLKLRLRELLKKVGQSIRRFAPSPY